MSHSDHEQQYSESGFWKKTTSLGRGLLEKALNLYYIAQDAQVPTTAKVIVYSALGYLISPLDLIPDTLPIIGYSDDLAVLTGVLVQQAQYVTEDIKQKTQSMLDKWFA